MSQAKKNKVNGSGRGVDTLLTTHGKALRSGEEIRFVLVKGSSSSRTLTSDPVNPKAPKEAFPLVAKFSESVVSPDFGGSPWNRARLYQRDVPKAEDDSDDEAANRNSGGSPSKQGGQPQQAKKRWRGRKQEPKRQWVLQEEVEFLETMMAKRQEAVGRSDGNINGNDGTSSMYEGMPEHNSSQFVLLEADTRIDNNIRVTVLPTPHATISFSRPKAVKALTMSEAEHAIDDQRNNTTRFMMHDQQRIFQGQAPIHRSRTRLLGKLMSGGDDDNDIDLKTGKKKSGMKRKRLLDDDEGGDEDDVMGDLTYRNRSSKSSAKARQELLNSYGDNMRVDADGVLGGGNDVMFGQRGQRFGNFAAGKDDGKKDGGASGGGSKVAGNDGNAMADDFYQRDVKAEYEELDYDASEQFDDDDVDVGETDVVMGESNFSNIDEDDDDDIEDDLHGERPTGAEGLASLAGFRLMLAKARGEITPEQLAELADRNKRQAEEEDKILAENDKKTEGWDSNSDHLAKIMEAAEKARLEAESKLAASGVAAVNNDDGSGDSGANGVMKQPKNPQAIMEVDENGQRLVTLEAVRHEIWLTRGRIPMKRLMKIFDVKKKSSQDRQRKFKEVVRELCTIETDPIGGRMLVLKQHYSRAN
mmetsp:Transcript_16022/g.37126  ORF Transcript_16022/g.37126 Transcript_16022/m.37126 type:complete len:643 (+) Transcript_16022:147-2075(+)|eukprot:CAMPEP_0197191498 /NCGR_PEP_ID=MMETSP1423-20130617/23519_1 /TAXON_ID=476441 /ORGANISM="Pseudo-nitzschia heimii, Strain UNC1101" /LENGTH=642 /DNA_ID=CAMNT_0042644155 /DNA_START=62 /DNA_END=1990 /DNA_ORIENTATION=-